MTTNKIVADVKGFGSKGEVLQDLRFYIAAPFFNEPQLALVRTLEDTFRAAGVEFFSPRLQHEETDTVSDTRIKSKEHAMQIFQRNYLEINQCSHLLAVTDWLLPKDQSVRVCGANSHFGNDHIAWVPQQEICVPDSGTVWELGYAYANQTPAILFTTRPTAKMNVMLAASAIGTLRGVQALGKFLEYLKSPITFVPGLEQWKGDFQ